MNPVRGILADAAMASPISITRWFLSRAKIASLLFLICSNLLAQTATDYTNDLPSVQRVTSEIKGTNATDTFARQVAVFTYLQTYIERIKYARTVRGPYSPGEQKLRADYRLAAYQISNEYAKTHTAAEAAAFERLHGQYEMNSEFYKDWSKRLIGTQAVAATKSAQAEYAASSKRFHDKIQQDLAPTPSERSHTLNAQGLSNDPTAVATRRCLELGGDPLACTGKSFVGGLISMTGLNLDELQGPSRAGVILSGVYGRSHATAVGFSGDSASVTKCGRLEPVETSYRMNKSGPFVQVTLATSPNPISLSLRPDGSLVGPGLVTINGQIITGYSTSTKTLMVDGAPAAQQGYDCGGPCTTTTSTPIYAPRTERCSIGNLAAPQAPPPPSARSNEGGLIGGLTSFMTTIVGGSLPGLRMEGKYFASGGLVLDFEGDAVILDCGPAHVKAAYTVENSPSQFLVHVNNSGGPFTLAVGSDNLLHGSGSTTVNGRLVSGMNGENITYVPRSETCPVGNFGPQGSQNSSTQVAASSPAPAPMPIAATSTVPRAAFRVLLGSSFSGTNPLAGQTVFVMRKPIDQVLRELGVSVPPRATAAQAMKALQAQCHSSQGCASAIQGMRAYYVAATKLDSSGKATMSATTETGLYYFFAIIPQSGNSLVWDVPTKLVAGDNPVTLSAKNAEEVR